MEDVGSQEGIGHQLPLYAQFAAALTLERIQGENFSNEKFSIELLSGFILDRELQGWRDISANSNQILEYHADLIFLACILGGINCFEDSLGNYLDLPVPHFSDLQAKLSLSRGFNLTDGYVPPIEPDALAELYVLYRLLVPRELYLFGSDSKARTLKLFKTALAATPETKEKVLNFLSRATDSFPKLVSDSGLLAFLNDPEMLTLTASRLTSHSVSSQDVEETLRVGDRLWRETRQEVARRDWMLAIAARICKERKTDVTWQFCTSKSYPSDFLGFCLLERGSAFIEDGDEETAWQDMNAVANLPDIPKQILGIACYNLGFLENKFGNYVQAAKYYNLVREHCQNSHEAYAKATVNLSALQERVGDAETAIGLLSEIVAMEGTPHEQQSLARAGVITWTARTGQYDRSLSLIDSWDDLLEDQDAEVRFQVRNSKGYCLMMKGQYDSAIKIFEGALSDHAPSIYAVHQAWINLAYCKENLGFDDDALVILERVRTDPTCNDETKAKSWQNSGHCWLKKQVLSIAISDFRTAAKWSLLFPEVDYGVKLGLLQCYLSAELIVESEQAFAKLQELPNLNSRQEAEVLMHSALLEEIRGDWHKREVAISKAFEKNPMEVIRLAQQWDWTEELEKFGGGGEN